MTNERNTPIDEYVDSLQHYSSDYYDPQKAHEYYERTKKLKGKSTASTSKLNDTGKQAANYVKSKLDEEKAKVVKNMRSESANQISSDRDKVNAQIQAHAKQMNTKIAQLKNQLKNKNAADRAFDSAGVEKQIASLRSENSKARASLRAAFSASSQKNRQQLAAKVSSTNDQYTEKYNQEVSKMNSDSKMKAKK